MPDEILKGSMTVMQVKNFIKSQLDYKILLEKYFDYINQCEGTNYIGRLNHPTFSDVQFTDIEVEILKQLDKKP